MTLATTVDTIINKAGLEEGLLTYDFFCKRLAAKVPALLGQSEVCWWNQFISCFNAWMAGERKIMKQDPNVL